VTWQNLKIGHYLVHSLVTVMRAFLGQLFVINLATLEIDIKLHTYVTQYLVAQVHKWPW